MSSVLWDIALSRDIDRTKIDISELLEKIPQI